MNNLLGYHFQCKIRTAVKVQMKIEQQHGFEFNSLLFKCEFDVIEYRLLYKTATMYFKLFKRL